MKKLALILGALGATSLLAGGAVAAYIITDNANKSGIHITPGTLEDDKTGTVTLSWGDMTSFTNITGLRADSPVTKSINIKADVKDEEGNDVANGVYLGKLDVELKDLSGKAPAATKLIDYLNVAVKGYAYANDEFAAEKSTLGSITAEGAKSISVAIYANKAGKQVDLEVSLSNAAAPVMGEILTDQVYLSVDWNRAAADENAVKHVYIPDNGWSAMYVYSYSASAQNADWPGVQLQKDPETGLYEADLLDHDYFIFTEAVDATTNRYPADGLPGMTKAEINYASASAIYFDWENHTFTNVAPVTLAPFYLLGEETAWDIQAEYGFVLSDENKPENAQHQWKLTATVVTGKDYKVRSGDGAVWVGIGAVEADCKIAETGLVFGDDNFQFRTANTYDFYLKLMNDSSYQLYIAVHA